MAPYPETETMTLKRVEVAIKKRDWDLLNEGITKIREKFDTNHKWEHYTQWRELLIVAEEAKLPDELWKNFCTIVSQIVGSDIVVSAQKDTITQNTEDTDSSTFSEQTISDKEKEEDSSSVIPVSINQQLSFSQNAENKNDEIVISSSFVPQEKTEKQDDENSLKEAITIFYSEDTDVRDTDLIVSYRNGLNSLMEKNTAFSPSQEWLNNLAYLVNSLNKPNVAMSEFLNIFKDIKVEGSIISAGYSSSVMQTMLKLGINFTMPAYRESDKTENYFKYITLGGLINSYICPSCGNKALKTGSHFDAVTGCCKKCASMIYPDICDISTQHAVSSSKNWYYSFNSMVNSRVWVLINPPYKSKLPVEEFLSYASSESVALQRVYIISRNTESASYWRHMIEDRVSGVQVKDHYPSISTFLDDFKNIEINSKTAVLA